MVDYRHAREFYPEQEDLFLAQSQQFLKATRFAAMLLSQNFFASTLPLHASYILQIGIEHSYDKHSNEVAGVDCDEWRALVPVATTWLSIAGKTIYKHCLDEDLYDGWEMGTWNMQ
jgi:hypothetical protein